jgi:hypothetical protein
VKSVEASMIETPEIKRGIERTTVEREQDDLS